MRTRVRVLLAAGSLQSAAVAAVHRFVRSLLLLAALSVHIPVLNQIF